MSFFLHFPNDCRWGIGVLRWLPVRWETYSIWVTRDLESHQTARHFLGKSPAERELLRVQLTTSRSDFSGEFALKKNPQASFSLSLLFLAVILTATQSHTRSLHLLCPLVLLSTHIHFLHSFSLLLPFHHPSKPPSPPSLSPLQINVTLRSVATPFLPQCRSKAENRSQVCRGWEAWILILRQ